MTNTITIELCAADRDRLDRILTALETKKNCENCFSAAAGTIEHIRQASNPPVQETPKPERVTATQAQPVDRDTQLRPLIVSLTNAGKKAEVRAVVNRYAPNVTAIPGDKIAECYTALQVLEG